MDLDHKVNFLKPFFYFSFPHLSSLSLFFFFSFPYYFFFHSFPSCLLYCCCFVALSCYLVTLSYYLDLLPHHYLACSLVTLPPHHCLSPCHLCCLRCYLVISSLHHCLVVSSLFCCCFMAARRCFTTLLRWIEVPSNPPFFVSLPRTSLLRRLTTSLPLLVGTSLLPLLQGGAWSLEKQVLQ